MCNLGIVSHGAEEPDPQLTWPPMCQRLGARCRTPAPCSVAPSLLPGGAPLPHSPSMLPLSLAPSLPTAPLPSFLSVHPLSLCAATGCRLRLPAVPPPAPSYVGSGPGLGSRGPACPPASLGAGAWAPLRPTPTPGPRPPPAPAPLGARRGMLGARARIAALGQSEDILSSLQRQQLTIGRHYRFKHPHYYATT
jgi:hypothetical protein